jgi:N-acetylneuraminic acid mutarotase
MDAIMTSEGMVKEQEKKAPSKWVEPTACRALCHLLLDDRYSCDVDYASKMRRLHRIDNCEDDVDSNDEVTHSSTRFKVADRSSSIVSTARRRPLPAALYVEHIATFLRFGGPLPNMLYVFGGRVPLAGFQTLRPSSGIIQNSVEMLDTWHGSWVKCPQMPCNRAGAAAACLPDGRLLVCGGYDERGVVEGLLIECDAYDPWQERWEAGVANLVRGRWGHCCAILNDRVYAVGGCSVWESGIPARNGFMETLRSCEVFEVKSGKASWQPAPPLQVPRSGARVVTLGTKYLVAVGGCVDPFGRVQMQASIELFDAEAGSWSLLRAHLASPRTCAVVAALDDQHIVACGGTGGEQAPGAPSSNVEVVSVSRPSTKQLPVTRGEEGGSEKLHDSEHSDGFTMDGVLDPILGRVGCQGAVLHLPSEKAEYPMCKQRCLVAFGGERTDRTPESKMFKRILDLDTGNWCSPDILPETDAPPRTAVALCVGMGRVEGARLQE